ncbi:MAG TPA: hypothetical protein VFU43_12815 [Streptosporangiaceae bacterium]|nr:hypothetical protein [Streptosporangiaceae bacterium]
MSITMSVPQSVTSRFVVAADEVPKDPYAMARAQVTGPPGEEVLDRLGTPLLSLRAVAAADSIWRDDLAAVAASDDERDRLWAAAGHLVIESETPPGERPRLAQAVRAVARALAETTGGLLADLCTAQIVRPDQRVEGERDWFCAADGWLGIDCRINPDGGMDTESPVECACLCLFTRGLSRFGLPDLVIDRVACAYDLAATNVMRGLAVRLLERLWADPGARELRLDEAVVVEPADMWGYWAARPLFGRPVPIRLAHASRGDLPTGSYLEILPSPDFLGTRAEWGTDVLNEGLSPVAGWQPDDPPYRIDPHPASITDQT